MAAAYISPAAEGAKPSAAQPRHSGMRKTLENLIHLIFLLCGVVAVAFVLLISIYLILSGIPAIREIGLGKFLFGKVWDPTNTTTGAQYGILAFILTSIYGTAGAILIGVPVGLLTAVAMFRASGALEWLTGLCAPALEFLGIPPETTPLMLVRPVSGSGALAVGSDLIATYGPDSYIGRVAAVMLGSTETTFYTIAVYFGSAGIIRTRHTVPAALAADLTGFLASAFAVRLFFGA